MSDPGGTASTDIVWNEIAEEYLVEVETDTAMMKFRPEEAAALAQILNQKAAKARRKTILENNND